ncbi:hypothetical protein [Sphingobacterium sp. SYP-B4668]|uniref:hypothetical protein n=1 Tax=Sphingobacterium sp. SYP-B4668 TaxID=2996035 RepID=UPI0022DE18C3|nr:hypothetical protein [Sphingobacterium sp. SYP-B4668]
MRSVLLLSLICLTSTIVHAQKKSKDVILPIPRVSGLVLDADLSDWNNRLQPVDPDSSWSYAVARDETHLYTSIRIKDKNLQREAVRLGLTFGVNLTGKKKEEAMLIYPLADREDIREFAQTGEHKGKDTRKLLINTAKGYHVKGFPTVVDGNLSFQNSYGIIARMEVDAQDNLCYEAAIPLKQLNWNSDQSGVVAIQLRVNDMWSLLDKKVRQRTNAVARPYGGQQQAKKNNKIQTEVWILTSL